MPLFGRKKQRTYGLIEESSSSPKPAFKMPDFSHFAKTPKFKLPKFKLPEGWWKKLIIFALYALVFCFIIGTGVVVWISKDLPDPNRLTEREVAESTKIYDRTGEHLLYEIYQEQKRTVVEMSEINPLAAKATIAIEDKYFYEHKGIRILSIMRAGFNNFIGRRTGAGGASTLTQQLIKNTMVGDEHSIWRKIKEAILALRLERKYDKETILKMYLNEIPYGSTNYGIEAASESYFRKTAKEINLAEAATLAAIPKAPSKYLNDLKLLRTRRDYVLDLMEEQGYITKKERDEAKNEPLSIQQKSGIIDAPHFVLYVKQILADKYGEKMVDSGGLKVITTLDYEKQMAAQEIIKEMGDKFEKEANANNAALVAIDPKTSQVLSMVGSRDFFNKEIDGQYNVAVLGRRQPGSSFKPFVYLAAFEKGYTPETVLYDVLTNFERRGDKEYIPKNYDGKEHGLVTMRKALQGSLNIPAVKTLYLVGADNMLRWAKQFGYTTFNNDPGLSLVLGGSEVSLLEHTNAYAALADNGIYHEPVSILKVTDNNGSVLEEWKENEGREAVKPELATLLTSVLTDNGARAYMFGLNSTLVLPDRPVAAKTGTTDDYKDAWTLGYVPSLAVGVWVGNTQPSPMKGGGNLLAGTIWNKFMVESLKNTPPENFPEPPVEEENLKPVLRGNDGGIKLPINISTGKIAAQTTPKSLIEFQTFLPPHTILYYVEKDDPRGVEPGMPSLDPQFESWETGLQDWVRRENEAGNTIVLSDPPTEYDPPTPIELLPKIDITFPTDSSTVTMRPIDFQATATSPRGVYKVTFYVDNVLIGESTFFPFGFSYDASRLYNGIHKLKVVAEDDQGNWSAKEIKFDLQAQMDSPDAEWFDSSPLIINSESFPKEIYLIPFRYEDIKEIKIYLKSSAKTKLIYTFDKEDKLTLDKKIFFTWKNNPGSGNYELIASIFDADGKKLTDRILSVVVE